MRRALPTALLLLIAGCTDSGGAPSLAPRPIEKLDTSEPAPVAPTAPAADPALAQRYAAIVAAAQDGDAAFARDAKAVRALASRATRAAPGSDPWIAAQQAVTRLEAGRGAVQKAMGDLDAERTSGEFDAVSLDAAVAQVDAIDARERDTLAAITRMLPAP